MDQPVDQMGKYAVIGAVLRRLKRNLQAHCELCGRAAAHCQPWTLGTCPASGCKGVHLPAVPPFRRTLTS